MKIVVNDRVHLSEFHLSDKPALVQHLNDRDIYDRTLRIPFPYTEASADEWLALYNSATRQQGQPVHFAIRTADNALIGGCGFKDFAIGKDHRGEIGYWLAKPFWGHGIMTAVVPRACRHAFEHFGLVKIIAYVGQNNPASARVLEKCGFRQEGLLRKHSPRTGSSLMRCCLPCSINSGLGGTQTSTRPNETLPGARRTPGFGTRKLVDLLLAPCKTWYRHRVLVRDGRGSTSPLVAIGEVKQ